METTPAILLRKIRLTETSLIVTWFTASHGRLKTVAKGARQAKSRFAGSLDLFFDCEILLIRSQRSELHTLREVVLRAAHEHLRTDFRRVALASYFVELMETVTELDHPAPELYDLLVRALRHLNESPASLRALLHFEAELVRLLGIQGQPGATPITAIGRAYHRIPTVRPALLKQIQATRAGGSEPSPPGASH